MHARNDRPDSSSLSVRQREEAMMQLELLLASQWFRQSKRYPAFLRYVVETTLQGADEEIKERTIGIEVFGRQPHYDTSLDPTVRLTAAEVRKRLAQYYQQTEHAAELHIDLRPGSYVPSFAWPAGRVQTMERAGAEQLTVESSELSSAASEPGLEAVDPPLELALDPAPVLVSPVKNFPGRAALTVAAMTCLVLVAVFVGRAMYPPARSRDIWAPLLRDPNSIALVLPDLSKTELLPQADETAATSVITHIRNSRVVDFDDSIALARLSNFLGKWNKPSHVLLSSDTTFGDLQGGPCILIGAVDNPWAMRFLEPLPFSVARTGTSMTFGIVSKEEKASADWKIDLAQPFGTVKQDYGIVARLTDTMTGRPVLILAGLGQNATAAGTHLLTDPALARMMTDAAPADWSGHNVEIVFRTQIINDQFGPPAIVARKYW